jgi:large subunit ribosomal protein L32e|tara:strand:+ start:2463 stop:2969 length:507 start_codon:yes stop_codon:yes gene_type:complete
MIIMKDGEKRRLMQVRKRISQKRPHFRQFEEWRLVRIKDHWRRPKGIDNKMRQKRKGWPRTVNVGFRSPKAVRYLHPSGMEEVAVFNVGDLTIVDPDKQVARIGGSVGLRKKRLIVKRALELDIRILNPGNIDSKEASISEEITGELHKEEEKTPENALDNAEEGVKE